MNSTFFFVTDVVGDNDATESCINHGTKILKYFIQFGTRFNFIVCAHSLFSFVQSATILCKTKPGLQAK